MSLNYSSFTAALLFVLVVPASAQTFEDLLGKSVSITYREVLNFSNDMKYVGDCSEKIYISPQRHIFFRIYSSARFGNNGSETEIDSFDAQGDEQGNGPGWRTKFRWDGSGFTRSWTEKSGDHMSENILIEGSSCRFERNRESTRSVNSTVSQTCSLKNGNVMR